MAELTYRDAVARGIAQEMRRDPLVVLLGEDIAGAGGVFKTTVGLLDEFGPDRVRDTPISEQAIIGAAAGAAMTGIPTIAEIMFSDFIAVCFDMIANEVAKARYMTDGQISVPMVIRTANGGGARFGAQHSQSVENWCMMIPGLKVVAPSTPHDVVGLMAASIRDPDPVVFFEHKSLLATKGEVPLWIQQHDIIIQRMQNACSENNGILAIAAPRNERLKSVQFELVITRGDVIRRIRQALCKRKNKIGEFFRAPAVFLRHLPNRARNFLCTRYAFDHHLRPFPPLAV